MTIWEGRSEIRVIQYIFLQNNENNERTPDHRVQLNLKKGKMIGFGVTLVSQACAAPLKAS